MAINKVIYDGSTLIDLTGDTVTADALYQGVKAHDKAGAAVTGTNPYNAATVDPQVTDILAAIAEKGVDTTGKGLGDIAALVAAIEAGGAKVATGKITPASNVLQMTIEHGLGMIPEIFLMVATGSYSTATNQYLFVGHYGGRSYSFLILSSKTSTSSYKSAITDDPDNFNAVVNKATETTIQVGAGINASYMFKSGAPYDWFAIGGLS